MHSVADKTKALSPRADILKGTGESGFVTHRGSHGTGFRPERRWDSGVRDAVGHPEGEGSQALLLLDA